jgi:eukaryotic-like serine/threonine-protein kinase
MEGGIVDGKYRLLRLVGEGGMGSVYEAEPLHGGEPRVALKLLDPSVLDGDDALLARFHREVRAASALDTPHVVRVLDSGTDPETDAPYLVMEMLRGEDLAQLLERVGCLAPDAVLRIAAQVCLALERAHGAGVIHRDIKPANLFLARREGGDVVVKILDFGIAKMKPAPGEPAWNLTKSGSVLGTPRYMSPEQSRASRSLDPRTDLWSLGMVLYHALSGHPPHHDAPDLAGLILAIALSPPRLSPELAPWVPPEVAAVVHEALEIDRARRFPSATAMLDAIRPLLPGGWSVDEGMLAPPAGAALRQAAPGWLAETRVSRSAYVDPNAATVGPAPQGMEVTAAGPGSPE